MKEVPINEFLIDFMIESNLIEGYETRKQDYYAFLRGETVYNHHVANSINAMLYVVYQSHDPKRQFVIGDMLTLHKFQMTNLLAKPGEFRGEVIVRVGTHIAPASFLYPALLDNWVIDFNDQSMGCWDFHARFETIHPFLDGNGRVGRLLWAWDKNRRNEPYHMFLDQFEGDTFEQRRSKYYQALSNYRK